MAGTAERENRRKKRHEIIANAICDDGEPPAVEISWRVEDDVSLESLASLLDTIAMKIGALSRTAGSLHGLCPDAPIPTFYEHLADELLWYLAQLDGFRMPMLDWLKHPPFDDLVGRIAHRRVVAERILTRIEDTEDVMFGHPDDPETVVECITSWCNHLENECEREFWDLSATVEAAAKLVPNKTPDWEQLQCEYGDAYLSASDIAARCSVKIDSLNQRLRRWIRNNPHEQGRGFLLNQERLQNEPATLYKLRAVIPIVRSLFEAYSRRPAENI